MSGNSGVVCVIESILPDDGLGGGAASPGHALVDLNAMIMCPGGTAADSHLNIGPSHKHYLCFQMNGTRYNVER